MIDDDGNISISFNAEDEAIVNKSIAQFNNHVKKDYDTVERLILMANILKDTSQNFVS